MNLDLRPWQGCKDDAPNAICKTGRYLMGWDLAPPKGDRCALTIFLTPEQHAATRRANPHQMDEEGIRIKQELVDLAYAFRCDAGTDAVVSVCVYNPLGAV